MSDLTKSKADCGADEKTPSVPQYFSWINNTNEGSTEKQTLINLDFFRYMKEKYGMQIRIYAWDAGNFDGASEGYGNLNGEKFKAQYPEGYKNVVNKAAELGIRFGLWGSPDGYGDDSETQKNRYDFFVHLCRDYNFSLFKLDGVCGQLRPEKAGVFASMLKECRKYSPDLIVLNHRLDLFEAAKHVTTNLWKGEETYVDVFAHNTITAMHNRAFMFRRGNTDNLERLYEDHGVCISSCIDYFEDDLIYQAFGRCLILAPEIYGNPWLMRDRELPELARVYNLHARNSAILVNGIALGKEYGCNAVSRGSKTKRFIVTGNDTWESKEIEITLDQSIGLETDEKICVNLHNPFEKQIGKFSFGDKVKIELMPFRAALIEIAAESESEPMLEGKEYKIIKEAKDGTPLEVNILNEENKEKAPVLLGKMSAINAKKNEANRLYEAAAFAANNDSLEYRSLVRSGASEIPEVNNCRNAFFSQQTYKLRGCESRNAFNGDYTSFFDGESRSYQGRGFRINGGCLRVDFGQILDTDTVAVEFFKADTPTCEVPEQLMPDYCEVSADLVNWEKVNISDTVILDENKTVSVVKERVHTLYDLKGKIISARFNVDGNVRFVKLPVPPDRIYNIKAYKNSKEVNLSCARLNNLQSPDFDVKVVKHAKITVPGHRNGARLAVALNGRHGDEGAFVCIRQNGVYSGCPNRAPEYKANVWEHRVTAQEENYTYFYPLNNIPQGTELDIYAVFNSGTADDYNCEIYLCDEH